MNTSTQVIMIALQICSMHVLLPADAPYQEKLTKAKIARLQLEIANEQRKLLPADEKTSPTNQGTSQWWNTFGYNRTDQWALFERSAREPTIIAYKKFWLPQSSFFSITTYEWHLKEQGCWVLYETCSGLTSRKYTLSFSSPDSWHWGCPGEPNEIKGTPEICPFEPIPTEPGPTYLSGCCRSLQKKIWCAARARHDKQA